ncbi:MAG: hypothetical protein EZS28_015444 [Streblomastix strix]|uniref:Uncharacterized protein n=1 Tax=Streblomastix strix TaxID=222440 RepID=A0A5J4W3C9_9EUKA|nr:MAG: hypothetical protein EZS28_015444 [Streblomastix strix]
MMQCVGKISLNDLILFEGNELNYLSKNGNINILKDIQQANIARNHSKQTEPKNEQQDKTSTNQICGQQTTNFIFHSMTCVTTPKRQAHVYYKQQELSVLKQWRGSEWKMTDFTEYTRLGSNMSSTEMNEKYARTLICVAGREVDINQQQQQQQKEMNTDDSNQVLDDDKQKLLFPDLPIFTDIFLMEVVRDDPEKEIKKISQYIKDNGCLDIKNEKEQQIQQQLLLEKLYKEDNKFRIPNQDNEIDIAHLSLILLKRIRIMGGVQGLYFTSSSLFILNGKALMLFFIHDSDILKKNGIRKEQLNKQQEKVKDSKQDNKQDNEDDQKLEINSSYDFCSCNVPYFSRENRKQDVIASILPYHYSITEVRSIRNTQIQIRQQGINNQKQHEELDYLKWFDIYNAFRRGSPVFAQMQFFIKSPSPITSVSSIILANVVQHWDQNYSSMFEPVLDQHWLLPPIYSRTLLCQRILLAYAPCGIAIADIQFNIENPLKFEQEIKYQRRNQCILDLDKIVSPIIQKRSLKEQNKIEQAKQKVEIIQDDSYNKYNNENQNDKIESNDLCIENQQSQSIHNSQSQSQKLNGNTIIIQHQYLLESQLLRPISHAAHMIRYAVKLLEKHGQKLKQMQQDLIFAYHARPHANLFSQKQEINVVTTAGLNGDIVALGRTPSLVIDAQIIGDSDFCVISDKNVLIYSLIPNVKHPHFCLRYKRTSSEIKKYPFDIKIYNGLVFEDKQKLDEEEEEYFKNNDGSERFMFNLLVSAIIPTNQGLSFTIPSTFGQFSVFGGIGGTFYKLLNKLNKEIHRPTEQLAAFSALALELMSETHERRGLNQKSVSDYAQLAHKIYHDELQDDQYNK